jgi:GTP diphosphokinase / guanosine-3',5'-bis(diphosphate) 3'-diphosphatase
MQRAIRVIVKCPMAVTVRETGAGASFERLLEQLSMQDRSLNLMRLRDAFTMAQERYNGRRHWTGAPLMEQVIGVLEILLPFQPDEDAIIGCLLQHIFDDHDRSLDELQQRFGAPVRSIVSGVHLLSHVTMRNRRMSIDQLRLMFLRVSDDARVILITLCAHSYCLDHLKDVPDDEARRFCRDSLTLFAPVAARLGIYSLKNSLEARAFPVVYASDAERLAQQMNELHRKFGRFLGRTAAHLKDYLEKEGMPCRIEAREKQLFSVFQKMQSKSINRVQDLYDLFAVRVIVENEAACYQVLGLLHRIGHPVPYRFKDYIAFPKPNGYQSLHTTLAKLPEMPDGLCVEVQVRTEEMHREAEYGIAAHWSYKEGGSDRARDRLSKAVAFQQAIEKGKGAVLTDHIFVLTPRGDIIELPEGATPLDFAFQVHTNLGISFRAARVNGSIVPLTYQLENGDIIEILRYREPRPSSRWATLLKTASARSRLKKYLARQYHDTYLSQGKEILNEELDRRSMPRLDPDLSLLRSVEGKAIPFADREEWIAKVGQGAMKVSELMGLIDATKLPLVAQRRKNAVAKKLAPAKGTELVSEIPMPLRYAKCCKPEEGKRSAVIGIVSRAGEIRVHRMQCPLIKKGDPGRRVKVRWN